MEGTLKEILAQGPKFEENILKAFERRKLVFFIGAGVSRIMGIMGWDEFSAFLVKKAFPNFKDHSAILRDVTNSKERITIAYKKFEQEDRLDEFYKHFGYGMTPNNNVFKSKENIYEILNRFEAIFLTTNADNLFEEVLGSALCHEDYNLSIIKSESQRLQNHLFYLHGHYTENIDKDKNNLVFTASQYVERYNDPNFVSFLEAIFQSDNTIVFIGYGLNEFELIDYIVTKSGHTSSSPKNVYVLHAFCENDDLLFEVKKSYFDALNIEVIPYDISKNGYDSLIEVLKSLYDDYQKRAIVPVTEIISECIANYNDENYATIKRYLTIDELAYTNEVQITREIQRLGAFEWTKRFFDDGLFSSQQMDKKIEYRSWPLLELLLDWVSTDSKEAKNAVSVFLNGITKEQLSRLSSNYSFINKTIVQIILSLDKDTIKAKYIDIIFNISKAGDLFGYGFDKNSVFNQISKWDIRIIRKLFDIMFYNVDIDSFRDNNSYIVDLFFNHFNSLQWDKRIPKLIFDYFEELIIINTEKSFNLFMHTNDLDNIYRNHKEYWKIVLTEIKYAFSQLSKTQKTSKIEKLIYSNNEALRKLALYLARKNNIDISKFVVREELFNSYLLYHEYYLLLTNQKEQNYLTKQIERALCTVISKAKFGIDKYDLKDEKDIKYFEGLILSKRLTLLQLLATKKAKTKANILVKQGVIPYPTITVADDCDYVHHLKWDNRTNINEETFKDLPIEQWVDKLISVCSNQPNDFDSSDCGREFVRLILGKSEAQQIIIIPTISKLPSPLLKDVLYELRSKRDKIISEKVLIDTCLDILNNIIATSPMDITIAKIIFELLSDIDTQDELTVDKILSCIDPWLNLSIDGDAVFIGDSHILTNLINYGDFYKCSVLLNCYIVKKKFDSTNPLDENIELLLELLNNDNSNKTIRYTLCYHYQNLKHLSNDSALKIFHKIFNYEPFDMTALILCCLNSNYIFKEIIEKIKLCYLQHSYSIPEECKDRILSDQFYSYVISSRYHNMLDSEDFEKAYADPEFVEYFLRCISIWAEKENFSFETYLIPCWAYIKSNYNTEKTKDFANLLMHSMDDMVLPTESILDMYLDIAENYLQPHSVHINHEKILLFFDLNKVKATRLIKTTLTHNGFIDIEKLKVILSKYKEYNLNRDASSLLNELSTNGIISNKDKENLAKILV